MFVLFAVLFIIGVILTITFWSPNKNAYLAYMCADSILLILSSMFFIHIFRNKRYIRIRTFIASESNDTLMKTLFIGYLNGDIEGFDNLKFEAKVSCFANSNWIGHEGSLFTFSIQKTNSYFNLFITDYDMWYVFAKSENEMSKLTQEDKQMLERNQYVNLTIEELLMKVHEINNNLI